MRIRGKKHWVLDYCVKYYQIKSENLALKCRSVCNLGIYGFNFFSKVFYALYFCVTKWIKLRTFCSFLFTYSLDIWSMFCFRKKSIILSQEKTSNMVQHIFEIDCSFFRTKHKLTERTQYPNCPYNCPPPSPKTISLFSRGGGGQLYGIFMNFHFFWL